jgi:hypothetical protein
MTGGRTDEMTDGKDGRKEGRKDGREGGRKGGRREDTFLLFPSLVPFLLLLSSFLPSPPFLLCYFQLPPPAFPF